MKFLFGILSLFILNQKCGSAKTSTTNSNKNSVKTEKISIEKIQDQNMTISYSAISRGTNKQISVSKTETIVEDNRAEKPKQSLVTSKKDWNEIKILISKIDTKSVVNLKRPSSKSLYDGALSASVKLNVDGKEITTQPFDHGNPPKKIAPLVNKLLSLMENNKK